MVNIKRKAEAPVMEQNKFGEMEYLTFPLLTKTGIVRHSFSTREGGASKGVYAGANFSFTRGDRKEDVEENYRTMAEILGYGRTLEPFVTTFQTHTSNVRRITRQDMGKGVCREREYVDVDGLITDEPGIILTTFHADCPPIYFVDPVHKAIGLSHSGWKGTVGRIGAKTAEAMHKAFGSDPSELICAIGPSICVDCYEVSEDVAMKFAEEFKLSDIPEYRSAAAGTDSSAQRQILWRKSQENAETKYQLDLWTSIRQTLLDAGVKEENIAVTDICTHCNSDYLFSHRTTGEKRGNLAAFLTLA